MAVINKSASIGASLTLRATPNRGYEFDHWSDLDSGSADYSNTNRTYIVKSSGNSLEAIFRNKDLGDITAIEGDGYEVVSSPGGSFIDIVPKHPIYGNTQVTINFDQNKEWYNSLVRAGEWANDIEITTDKYTPTINIPANVLEDLLYNGSYGEIAFTDRFGRRVGLDIDQPRGSRIHIINNTGLPNGSIKILNNTNEVRIDWNGNRSYSFVPEGANTLVVDGDDIQHNAGGFLSGSNPFTMNVLHKVPFDITLTRGIYHNISIFWPTGGLEYSYNGTPYVISYDSRVKQGSNLYVSLSQNVSDGPTDTGYVKQLAIKVGDKIYGNSIPNITSEVSGLAYLADSLTINDVYILSPWGDVHTGEILHNATYGTLPSIEIVDSRPTQGNGKWQVYVDPQDGKKFKGWLVRDPMMGPDQEVEGKNSFPDAGTIRPWFEVMPEFTFIPNNCIFNEHSVNEYGYVEFYAWETYNGGSFDGSQRGIIKPSFGPTLWPHDEVVRFLSTWELNGQPARVFNISASVSPDDIRGVVAANDFDIFTYRSTTNGGTLTLIAFKTPGTYKPIENVVKTFNIVMGPTDSYVTPENSTIRGHNAVLYFPGIGGRDIESNLADNERIIYSDTTPFWDLDMLVGNNNNIQRRNLIIYKDGVDAYISPERGDGYIKVTLTEAGDYSIQTYNLGGYRDSVITFDYSGVNTTSVTSRRIGSDYVVDFAQVINALNLVYGIDNTYTTVFGKGDIPLQNPSGAVSRWEYIIPFEHDDVYRVVIRHNIGQLNITVGRNNALYSDTSHRERNILVSPTDPRSIHSNSFLIHI